jgi:hypothetical protein
MHTHQRNLATVLSLGGYTFRRRKYHQLSWPLSLKTQVSGECAHGQHGSLLASRDETRLTDVDGFGHACAVARKNGPSHAAWMANLGEEGVWAGRGQSVRHGHKEWEHSVLGRALELVVVLLVPLVEVHAVETIPWVDWQSVAS